LQVGSKDLSKLDALFNVYRGKDSEDADVMGPEGGWGAQQLLLLPTAASAPCLALALPSIM
jgi:hypothetical protein